MKYAMIAFLALTACGQNDCSDCGNAPAQKTKIVSSPRADVVKPDATYVTKWYEVFPTLDKGQTVGNTGLAIDTVGGRLFHARYDWTRSSKIEIRSRENKALGEIDVSAFIDHIQGVAYDSRTNTVYAWGMPKGVEAKLWSSDYVLEQFAMDGSRVGNGWHTPAVDGYPGMIVIDEERDLIWLKANGRAVAHAYDLGTKALAGEIDFKVAGEGIAWDAASRQFWVADKGGIYRFDDQGSKLNSYPNPTFDGASEGMAFDTDGTVWLNADEGLHGDHPQGNRVWHVTPAAL